MGGPGSGRRPKITNGANGHTPLAGQRVTFGDLLSKMQAAPPAAGPPIGTPQTITTPPPAAPLPPPERPLNRSFAKIAGGVVVNVGITVLSDQIRKSDHEPNDLSQETIDGTTEATEDAIVRVLGDGEVPWWAGLIAAWGNLYLAMRVGAKPVTKKADAESPAPTTTTTTTPASPLGHGGGPLRPPPAPGRGLAPIRVIE